MKNQFEAFIDDLRSTHRKNLVAVILYGSAAAGDFIPKQSDYNILVALDKITPDDLRNANPAIREWHKRGNPVPVYFTVSELQNAADVFPIEFLQMDKAHKVLYGRDVLDGLSVSDDALRHQVEYELRSKLLRLRRTYIPACGSGSGVEHLMSQSISSIATLFGAVLTLLGHQPPAAKRDIVAMAADRLKLDFAPFDKIFDIKSGTAGHTADDGPMNALFAQYLEQIERVIEVVDKIETKQV